MNDEELKAKGKELASIINDIIRRDPRVVELVEYMQKQGSGFRISIETSVKDVSNLDPSQKFLLDLRIDPGGF